MAASRIAHLKVILDGVEPAVVRHLEVPVALRLDRLHQTLQVAMGWTDSHLWGFEAGRLAFGPPIPGGGFPGDPADARKATLKTLLDTGEHTIVYTYDFGDDWAHIITIERVFEGEPGQLYPRIIEATGACPPEDVGGVPGYEDFLEAIADPEHEEHDELVDWCGGTFDPHAVDLEMLDAGLRRWAKVWSRKPPARKATKSAKAAAKR